MADGMQISPGIRIQIKVSGNTEGLASRAWAEEQFGLDALELLLTADMAQIMMLEDGTIMTDEAGQILAAY